MELHLSRLPTPVLGDVCQKANIHGRGRQPSREVMVRALMLFLGFEAREEQEAAGDSEWG